GERRSGIKATRRVAAGHKAGRGPDYNPGAASVPVRKPIPVATAETPLRQGSWSQWLRKKERRPHEASAHDPSPQRPPTISFVAAYARRLRSISDFGF